MKTRALAFSALIAAVLPLHAQVSAAPDGTAVERPSPSCPCDESDFKPLTEKARAAETYWDARRKTKIAVVVGGTGALFSLLFGDVGRANEAAEVYNRAHAEMITAKTKAVALGAVTVVGEDLKGEITFHLKKGVDF